MPVEVVDVDAMKRTGSARVLRVALRVKRRTGWGLGKALEAVFVAVDDTDLSSDCEGGRPGIEGTPLDVAEDSVHSSKIWIM